MKENINLYKYSIVWWINRNSPSFLIKHWLKLPMLFFYPIIKKNKYIKMERKILNMKNIKFEKQKINKTEIEDKEYLNLYFRNINSLISKKHKPSRKKFK